MTTFTEHLEAVRKRRESFGHHVGEANRWMELSIQEVDSLLAWVDRAKPLLGKIANGKFEPPTTQDLMKARTLLGGKEEKP